MARTLALLAIVFVCSAGRIVALDSTSHISQYGHNVWRVQDGAFHGSPNLITQTRDGYLWIGTDGGLVRFDGVRFVSWSPPAGARLSDPRIFSVLGARDGSLWIGTGYSLAHWSNGELNNLPLSGRIEDIAEGSDGVIWLVRTQITDGMGPVCRIKSGQVRCYGEPEGILFPDALRVIVGDSGELWIGGYYELCRWEPGTPCTRYFAKGAQAPETFATIRAIAAARDGTVWAAREQPGRFLQLEHFEHQKWVTRNFPEIAVSNKEVTTLFVGRDNVLWIGTSNHGMFRVVGDTVDHYGHIDGLSSDAVGRFYEDAEGTVWAVTSEGIDNFRDVKVLSYSMREGLSAAGAGSVLATRDGTVWVGNFHALDRVREGKLSAIRAGQGLPGLNVTTFLEDHAGKLWVGIDSELWVYDGGVFRAVRHADGSPLGMVFAITEDTRNNIWVRAAPDKLDRIYDARLQEEIASPQIKTAYILAANPKGGIFLGLVDGDLVQYEDGKTRTYSSNEAGDPRQIRDLLVEADGSVWGTTLDELVRWKDGVRKNLSTRNGLPCDVIYALVKDARGSLWLDSKCGLIEIERSQLDSWWEHPDSLVKFNLLDASDGVRAGLTPLKPQATRSTDGRLWFVNGRILQVVDPDHLRKNPAAPPVQIEEVFADHRNYSPRSGLRLPALTRDLQIDYTALSFVAPQRVHFRYRLEGHDSSWQEPGTRRQAFYSNLGPGTYRFRVIACNNDGVWNEAGASLAFSILPAFYQTVWFRAICVAALVLFVWTIYQLRIQQLQRQFAIGMEARVNERTRIARELHDTLLQTLHGLMFQFQAVRNLLPRRPEEAMKSLDDAIHETEKALTESRDAIQGLRSEPIAQGNVAELLMAASRTLADSDNANHEPPVFELIEEGERQALSPTTKNEVCRIAIEILRNAFRHAHATRIEAEIRYDVHMLRLRIRDNGKGIDPKVLKADGSAGHWGLRGVRERAERIGSQLDFWSETGAGTEVQLTVPASVAYETAPGGTGSRFQRKTRNRA